MKGLFRRKTTHTPPADGSRTHEAGGSEPTALELVAAYTTAQGARDGASMAALCGADFVLDFVHGDAFEDKPLTHAETKQFWPAWFAAFPEMDYEITRTVAAEAVVVIEWVFTGTHSQPLGKPVFDEIIPPSGRTVCFRGVSVFDVVNGRIQRETAYMDLATIMVELGVTL